MNKQVLYLMIRQMMVLIRQQNKNLPSDVNVTGGIKHSSRFWDLRLANSTS